MTRVLHYGMSSNLGGIETYLWNLARTIDREAFAFDYLFSDTGRPPAYSQELTELGSSLHGVTPRRDSPTRNRRELAALITPERFDILHFHVNTASYVEPVRAALRTGVRVIVHSHNAGASRSPVTQLLHRVNSRTIPWRRISKVAVSDEAARWMFRRTRDVTVIPNGIDIDTFRFNSTSRERLRGSLGAAGDTLVLGHVGAFLPAKNHEFAVDVFAEVLRRRPTSMLLLAGTGPLVEKTRSHVQRLGLQENVRFLGRRQDVADLFSAMDCLIFPSRYEGFGLVVLEAQASGLPTVVSEAIPSGVLVTPSATRLPLDSGLQAWADAALAVETSPDRDAEAERVRAAGYSLATNTARVEDLYQALRGS